jgi:lysophospholipase L1-like esterase
VSTGIHISSAPATFWRARTSHGGNWFLDTDPSPGSIRSVSKRLELLTSFVATEYAGIGAMVDDEGERLNLFRRILGTRHLSGQVTHVLERGRFPDLILISLGHNNADWTWWSSPGDLEKPDNLLRRQARVVGQNFARELQRLIRRAQKERHRVAITVFGLINFGTYFQAREKAERLRAGDRALYPHLETTYRYFNSMRPPYRRELVRFAVMINEQLRAQIDELRELQAGSPNLLLQYSNAMAEADFSPVEVVHRVDGWHPSVTGHNILAEAAFGALGESLEFLGMKGPAVASSRTA